MGPLVWEADADTNKGIYCTHTKKFYSSSSRPERKMAPSAGVTADALMKEDRASRDMAELERPARTGRQVKVKEPLGNEAQQGGIAACDVARGRSYH